MVKMREQSTDLVLKIVQMEKLTDYTCNPENLDEWNKLVAKQKAFIYDVPKNESSKIQIEGFGGVEVNNLRVSQAFDDCELEDCIEEAS
jgi:two-component SAPR family response regulator